MTAPHSSDVPRSRRAVTLTDLDLYDQRMLPNGDGAHGVDYLISPQNSLGSVEIDPTETAQGARGAFIFRGAHSIEFQKKIPVGTGQRYRISGYAKTLSGEGLLYVGIRFYDAYDSTVGVAQFMYDPDATTVLARDLNPGDTTVYLEDSAGWPGMPDTPDITTYRSAIVWNYVDPGGKKWPFGSFSRNVLLRDTWAHGAVDPVAHTITLRRPHVGFSAEAGTLISASRYSGGMHYMPTVTGIVPSDMPSTQYGWYEFSDVTPGLMREGGVRVARWDAGVPPGAAYFKLHVLPNYQSNAPVTDVVAVSDLAVSEAGAAFARANEVSDRLDALNAGVGLTYQRPENPVQGQQFFDRTLARPIWWDGSKWINASGGTV